VTVGLLRFSKAPSSVPVYVGDRIFLDDNRFVSEQPVPLKRRGFADSSNAHPEKPIPLIDYDVLREAAHAPVSTLRHSTAMAIA